MKQTPLKRKTPLKPRNGLKKTAISPKKQTYKTKNGHVKKKTNPYWKQVQKTDRLFSVLVRLMAADHQGMVRCFTCGFKGPWKYGKLECGHFKGRANMNTRWCFINNNVQCEHCNRSLNGNLVVYRANLMKKYGAKIIKDLEARADEIKKWTVVEMKELRSQFNRLIKEVKKEKGL